MKFKKGQKAIPVPPMGELLEVFLVTNDAIHIRLSIVHMEEIQAKRKAISKDRAWPMVAALAQGAWEVHIWPTPHKAGELKIRYYPPQQEI